MSASSFSINWHSVVKTGDHDDNDDGGDDDDDDYDDGDDDDNLSINWPSVMRAGMHVLPPAILGDIIIDKDYNGYTVDSMKVTPGNI